MYYDVQVNQIKVINIKMALTNQIDRLIVQQPIRLLPLVHVYQWVEKSSDGSSADSPPILKNFPFLSKLVQFEVNLRAYPFNIPLGTSAPYEYAKTNPVFFVCGHTARAVRLAVGKVDDTFPVEVLEIIFLGGGTMDVSSRFPPCDGGGQMGDDLVCGFFFFVV